MYGLDHGGWMFGGGFVMLLRRLLPVALVVFAAIYLKSYYRVVFIQPFGKRHHHAN